MITGMYKDIMVKCKDCGEEFEVRSETISALVEKGYEIPKRCFRCREIRKSKHTPVRQIVCVDCGQPFNLSEFDDKLFKELKYKDPIRCWGCRQNKKRKYNT